MNTQKLENNLIDLVMEQQAKLGFLPETVRLYYPPDSLCRLLGAQLDVGQLQEALDSLCIHAGGRSIPVMVTHSRSRFCFTLPPEVSALVHDLTGAGENISFAFLRDFVGAISEHGCTIGQIRELFGRYSACVHFEAFADEDFDYLLYFEDGVPDSYRYCLTEEGPHLIYHRYTPEDYESLMAAV